MYESYYKLSSDPFQLCPRTQAGYKHGSYAKARSYVIYALARKEGMLMITGKPGTGKTTLIRDCVRESADSNVTFIEMSVGRLDGFDFLCLLALKFDIEPDDLSQARIIMKLQVKFEQLYKDKKRAVLLVDEAQGLEIDAFEEVKSLANLEVDGKPLLQIFLVGHTSLIDNLKKPEFEQIMQRITASCELTSMNLEESSLYIKHCLQVSGWSGSPEIADEVLAVIYKNSGGLPRRTNLICSRLLLRSMLNESKVIGLQDLQSVLDDLYKEKLIDHQPSNKLGAATITAAYPREGC